MLCSKCSANVTPIAVFDVDGTTAKYHSACFTFVRRYWGLQNGEDCWWDGSGDFEDYIGVTKQQYREAKLAFRQGGAKRTMMPYHDALQTICSIAAMGVDIWFVTNRPWLRLDNVDPDTRFWLDRQALPYSGLLFGDDKYGDLVKIVDPDRIIGVVEDLPEQFDRAAELGLPVWQVERHHNHHTTQERHPRGTMTTIAHNIATNHSLWQEQHG